MNQQMKQGAGTGMSTKDLVMSGLLTALVFISTKFINIRLPISVNGGLIHMGNVMLFASAIVFGKKKGAVAGAFGMGLFDLVSGWTLWAPFTFVIRGLMGYIIGSFAQKSQGRNLGMNLLGILLASSVMIVGYYITEGILYGNWYTPLTSVYGNLIQLIAGTLIGIPVSMALLKSKVHQI